MKRYDIQVRTRTAYHRWTALAASSTDALMAAWDRFGDEPVAITVRPYTIH